MDENIQMRNRGFTLKGWHIALVGFVVLVVLVGLYAMVRKNKVEERIKALRVAGYPTSFAELEEYTKLPEGVENAAVVYTRAFAAFVPPVDEANVPILGKARLPGRGVPLPGSMTKTLSECLAANRSCLALLHDAAGVEHCRYDWDYADELLLWKTRPHTEGVRHCLQLLWLSTIFHAWAGDADAAVAGVRDGLHLSESVRRDPGQTGYLLRIASRAVVLNGLEWALSATPFTDRQLVELDRMLAASAATLDLKEALITERCFAIEKFKSMKHSGPPPLGYLIRTREIILWAPGMQGRGLPDTLDYMGDYVEAADLPIIQRMTRFREVQDELAGRSILHAMAKTWAPLFAGRMFELDPRIRVHLDLARTALAIERGRLSTGKAPGQLEELVPQYLQQVPPDPFDGQPIRYRRAEPGYCLYSILEDGQDNGGRERGDVKPGEPYDWCFTVAR